LICQVITGYYVFWAAKNGAGISGAVQSLGCTGSPKNDAMGLLLPKLEKKDVAHLRLIGTIG
jgi:hypothetical protein